MAGRTVRKETLRPIRVQAREHMEQEAHRWISSPDTTALLLADLHHGGVTYKHIAEEIGVTYMTIFRWARGLSKPRPALPVNEKLMLMRNIQEVGKRAAIIAEGPVLA
jgi:predicted transcriptional regulator